MSRDFALLRAGIASDPADTQLQLGLIETPRDLCKQKSKNISMTTCSRTQKAYFNPPALCPGSEVAGGSHTVREGIGTSTVKPGLRLASFGFGWVFF